MRPEFQDELLRWLVQTKEAVKYIKVLESDVFDLVNYQIVFGLLQGFVEKYNGLPSMANLVQYYDTELNSKKEKFDNPTLKIIEDTIRASFTPIITNSDQIRDTVVKEYQKKLTATLFVEYSSQVKDADDKIINEIYNRIQKIKNISENNLEDEQNKGKFLLRDFEKGNYNLVQGIPTYLKALNRMTSTGGFYSPQIIIFMGAPKSFKTGTLLNIARGYMQDGHDVYYADAENGEDRIADRMKQSMLQVTYRELVSGEEEHILESIVSKYKLRGGDFISDFYPANTKTMRDVEARLQELRDENNGWTPKVICFDYLDLFNPEDSSIKDKRLQIQAVYKDAARLCKRWDALGFSLSQVGQQAVEKVIIKSTDFAEDFGKASNAHAAFALCGTPAEREKGYIRILPVVQRDGVAQHSGAACYVKVDEGRMMMEEVSYDTWYEDIGHIFDNEEIEQDGKAKRKFGGGEKKERASTVRKHRKNLEDE